MMKKIFKAFKTTILGLLFIAVGVYLLVNSITFDYWIVGGLIVGGVLLLFTGDKFINQLEKYVYGKVLFEDKNKVEGDGI